MTTTLTLSTILMLAVIIAFIVIYSNTKKIIAKIKAMEKEAHESDIFSPWTIM